MDQVLLQANQKIQNALEHIKRELASIRAGRANPTLIENIPVTVYGSRMKLVELGTISAPQPSLLTIQVWDASIVSDIQKALTESNLGINPATDGQTIRLPIPPLSQERREEFVRLSRQKGESCKVEIRQIRTEYKRQWEAEKVSGEIGEDELRRREKLLQDLVDKSVALVDECVKLKEEELRQI